MPVANGASEIIWWSACCSFQGCMSFINIVGVFTVCSPPDNRADHLNAQFKPTSSSSGPPLTVFSLLWEGNIHRECRYGNHKYIPLHHKLFRVFLTALPSSQDFRMAHSTLYTLDCDIIKHADYNAILHTGMTLALIGNAVWKIHSAIKGAKFRRSPSASHIHLKSPLLPPHVVCLYWCTVRSCGGRSYGVI
ncbi:hypothetical protein DFH08DRAFT_828241 [Mycena albidolilacea]|uniref:Uncharacterized protein n=1 Tax=Mycena albidolilacea TaxID=1033008 RepID=A0AAD6YWQ0_9AGAR|nr:hypothetical protein DFH08DRAFT_828241 [Mycena albidolilacea]